jgi:hypothetical protein
MATFFPTSMKILKLLALSTAMLAAPLSAQEAAPAPSAPVPAETAAAPPEATAAPEAVAPVAEASRPLPKVRQGTPFIGNRHLLILFSILFFLLSVVMASVIIRSKEDIPA